MPYGSQIGVTRFYNDFSITTGTGNYKDSENTCSGKWKFVCGIGPAIT